MTEAEQQRHHYIAGSLPAVASSVTTLRHEVTRFARAQGFDDEIVFRIALAVTEAANNAVLHAYGSSPAGVIGDVAAVDGDDLQLVVSDDGSGIRASHRSEGVGLGLALIAELTSDFGIGMREPSGLEVWMRFLPE